MPKTKGPTATSLIRRLILEGKNSIQIFLIVKDRYPKYDDRKLRQLISVIKNQYRFK